jgi:hypothetical protein
MSGDILMHLECSLLFDQMGHWGPILVLKM